MVLDTMFFRRFCRPSSTVKHYVHCFLFCSTILAISCSFYKLVRVEDSLGKCGLFFTILLYFLSSIPLLLVPLSVCTFLGLTLYNPFEVGVQLDNPSLVDAPFICLRLVTRGDYPELVKDNVTKNLHACLQIGLVNFIIEVVSQKHVEIPDHPKIRLLVVPDTYETKNKSQFKARNLQYCLEEAVNALSDSDWILHLDEDSVCTAECLKGVVNFTRQNRHPFGQGFVELDSDNLSVWPTNLLTVPRLLMDMGYGKFQFQFWNNCFFGWKGSFMLCKMSAEREVTFDGGPRGSISENCCFAMTATQMGFSFGWVEGAMLELGPLTPADVVKQSCRILQGIKLCLQKDFRFRNKLSMYLYGSSFLVSFFLPVALCVDVIYPLPFTPFLAIFKSFALAVNVYGFAFWALRRFNSDTIFKSVMELFVAVSVGYVLQVLVAFVVTFRFLTERGSEFQVTKKVQPRAKVK